MAVDTLSLTGKTALVTGSGRENGIGAAIARTLARNGASVAIHYVSDSSKARAEKVATNISKEFGTKTTVVQGSVENPQVAKSIVEQTLKGLGADRIDILINNAGAAGSTQELEKVTPEALEYEFGVNVFGVIYMVRAVVNEGKMPKGGRIINIGTVASKMTSRGTAVYSAAKAAQDSLTTSWADELGRTHGITVNTLAPGAIPTDMSKPYLETPDGSPNPVTAGIRTLTRAEDRLGTVEDMADAVLLLVSEKSRWITAQWISISGGVTGTILQNQAVRPSHAQFFFKRKEEKKQGIMPEELDQTSSEPNHQCTLCKRTFAQESTRKRHYYYCRTKLSDTNVSRRRSCAACVRAKTRCVWGPDSSLEACVRCSKRGAKCEYKGPDAALQENANTSILVRRSNGAENSLVSVPAQGHQTRPYSIEHSTDGIWNGHFLDGGTPPGQGIGFTPNNFGRVSKLLVTGSYPSTPSIRQISSVPLFNPRVFTKPNQGPMASLAVRMLRSYPFMMLQKGALPPFMSPLVYSWAKKGRRPQPQVSLFLASFYCAAFSSSFMRIQKTALAIDESKTVNLKILTEYPKLDQWELLACLQALLVYCLLRLQEVPVGNDVLDVSLLTTSNLVSGALSSILRDRCDCDLPGDPNAAWRDWVFNESRRRTVLIFQIMSMLVDMLTTVSSHALAGFVLVPLPSASAWWNAQSVEEWKMHFRRCYEERTIYGVSEAGELTRLHMTETGVECSEKEWEEWSAEVSDLGTLVMVVGTLL
ncbi:hypothetical protein AK830_g8429 [Neonectria ditissima]|uniref:Zn(2)-C6 fungal-type domain-containing protein n=1 Tax=Neonectria ditissima TaxID=78410 RepID=A0A0P7BE88_9HYPO|nr:hypothetical protein AK830_g8429 [Neonectria ditissima]